MNVGVLALQGAFIEHEKAIKACGENPFEIRSVKDLNGKIDGLIIPGGESTVMRKLLTDTGLFLPIKKMIDDGLPVMGTCAGLILLAKKIENESDGEKENEAPCFNALGITVKRNAYGRQLASFISEIDFADIGKIDAVFIRAPRITAVSSAEILAKIGNTPVAVREKNVLGLSFHPELTDSTKIHEYFLNEIKNSTR